MVTLKFNNPGIRRHGGGVQHPRIYERDAQRQALANGTDFQYDAAKQKLTIPYTGATALIVTLARRAETQARRRRALAPSRRLCCREAAVCCAGPSASRSPCARRAAPPVPLWSHAR